MTAAAILAQIEQLDRDRAELMERLRSATRPNGKPMQPTSRRLKRGMPFNVIDWSDEQGPQPFVL